MRGLSGYALVFVVVGIVLVVAFLLAWALPTYLKAIGFQEWGELVEDLQNVQKYRGEEITLVLPANVDDVMFVKADQDGFCPRDVCGSMCINTKTGDSIPGKSFILLRLDESRSASLGSVIWKTVTLRLNQAKAEATELASIGVTDMCIVKNFEVDYLSPGYVSGPAMILPGDGDLKKYCLGIEENTGVIQIGVIKETSCLATG